MKKDNIWVIVVVLIVASFALGLFVANSTKSTKEEYPVASVDVAASVPTSVEDAVDAAPASIDEYSIPMSSDVGDDYGAGEEESEYQESEQPQLQPDEIVHITFDTRTTEFNFFYYQLKYFSKVDNLTIYRITVNDGACVDYNKTVTLNRGQRITLNIGTYYSNTGDTRGCSTRDVYKTEIFSNYGNFYFTYK